MADYQLQSSKFHKELQFTATGILNPTDGHKLYGETSLVSSVENVTGQNEIIVEGRLEGSSTWVQIGELEGPVVCDTLDPAAIDISRVDYIRFTVSKYAPVANKIPKLICSAYYAPSKLNEKIENLLETQNNHFLKLNCSVEQLVKSIQNLETQIETITGLTLGDK